MNYKSVIVFAILIGTCTYGFSQLRTAGPAFQKSIQLNTAIGLYYINGQTRFNLHDFKPTLNLSNNLGKYHEFSVKEFAIESTIGDASGSYSNYRTNRNIQLGVQYEYGSKIFKNLNTGKFFFEVGAFAEYKWRNARATQIYSTGTKQVYRASQHGVKLGIDTRLGYNINNHISLYLKAPITLYNGILRTGNSGNASFFGHYFRQSISPTLGISLKL